MSTAPAGTSCACNLTRARVAWAEEELMTSVLRGLPMATDVIDQLPPGRAQIVVTLCLRAGGRLENGDEQLFVSEVEAARIRDAGATGWWREALTEQMPPVIPRPAKPTNTRK